MKTPIISFVIILFFSVQSTFGQASDKTKRNFGYKERSIELHACGDAGHAIERHALSYKGIRQAAWNRYTHRLTIRYDIFHATMADSLQRQLPLVWPGCETHVAKTDSNKGILCSCR